MSELVTKISETPVLNSPSQILGLASNGSLGRVSIARFLTLNGTVADINDAWGDIGIYRPSDGCLNYPTGVTPNSSDSIICTSNGAFGVQILIPILDNNVFRRKKMGTSWGDWYIIAATIVS